MPPKALDAREYKLLLNANAINVAEAGASADMFWNDHLIPVLERRASPGNGVKFSYSGSLAKTKVRNIQFWDTEKGALSAHGFSLRCREAVDAGGDDDNTSEVSLKLRTPDLCAAAAAAPEMRGKKRDAKTKLEEDIAPLAISHIERKKQHTCFSSPPSMRSRFSLSTRQEASRPLRWKDLQSLFPRLDQLMASFGGDELANTEPLISGPRIRETVAKGATVDFGDGFEGEFTLTTWEMDTVPSHRSISEISYKCKLPDGEMSLAASLRALELFVAIQTDMADIIEMQLTSKTILAVPRKVGAP